MIYNHLFGYQYRQQRNYFRPVVTLLVSKVNLDD